MQYHSSHIISGVHTIQESQIQRTGHVLTGRYPRPADHWNHHDRIVFLLGTSHTNQNITATSHATSALDSSKRPTCFCLFHRLHHLDVLCCKCRIFCLPALVRMAIRSPGLVTHTEPCDCHSLQSLFYHSTLFYQNIQGAGPVTAMLYFLPTTISGVLCNVLVAWLVARVPTQWIICVGIVATGYVISRATYPSQDPAVVTRTVTSHADEKCCADDQIG